MSTINQDMSESNLIFVHSKLDELGLEASEFRVYSHLARRANMFAKAWPGIDSMAKTCVLSRSTVIRAISNLTDWGMIRTTKKMGFNNEYVLTKPSEWKHPNLVTVDNVRASEPEGVSNEERGECQIRNGVVPNEERSSVKSGTEGCQMRNVSISIEGTPSKVIQKKSKKPQIEPSEEAKSLVTELYDLIRLNDPHIRDPKDEKLKRQQLEAHRLITEDGRPKEEASRVLAWAKKDKFWGGFIFSISKFRQKYPTLRAQWREKQGHTFKTEVAPKRQSLSEINAMERAQALSSSATTNNTENLK